MGNTCCKPAARSSAEVVGSSGPDEDAELRAATLGEDFTFFDGLVVPAKAVSVYDGDTLRLVFRFHGQLVQLRCRMLGYDCPEMRPPLDAKNRDQEIAAAKLARDALVAKLAESDGLVEAAFGRLDNHARPLVTLTPLIRGAPQMRGRGEGGKINEWMLQKGYGAPYSGRGSKASDAFRKAPDGEQVVFPFPG